MIAPTNYAGQVDNLLTLLLIVSGFFFVVVVGATIYFAIRYRSGKVKRPASQNRGFLPLEIIWAVVPLIVVGVIAIISARDVASEDNPPADAMVVNVIGQRFRWTFDYPDLNITTTGDLHLPKGRDVKLNISSKDVIHSFWVPAFRIKEDAVPGRDTFIWLHTDQSGTFDARCAQLCGIGHYEMTATVSVVSQNDFDAWVTKQRNGS